MSSPFTALRAIILVAVALRCCMSLHPHSGFGVKPLHGDFEAQRHWVEITTHLPREEWYRNGTDNDLQYWGIDYPPWSAYHALLIGKVAWYAAHAVGRVTSTTLASPASNQKSSSTASHIPFSDQIVNQSFGLFTSRGAEDVKTVFIMRLSSLVTDVLFWIPPALLVANDAIATTWHDGGADRWIAFLFLFAPLPQLFIDHGHFQFNSVPGGLILLVLVMLGGRRNQRDMTNDGNVEADNNHLTSSSNMPKQEKQKNAATCADKVAASTTPASPWTGSFMVSNALCAFLSATAVMFKQMSLYWAPAIAVALLFRCVNGDVIANDAHSSPSSPPPASAAAAAPPRALGVAFNMVVCLVGGVAGFVLPVLPLQPLDVVTRMFPFSRGLFEDKVANVWCAISPVIKMHNIVSKPEVMVRICALVTVVTFLPAAVVFFYRSWKERRASVPRAATLLTVSALCFFLFAFQVHEKSILMAVASTVVIWVYQDSRQQPRAAVHRLACAHFMLVSMVSLQPLAVKDKLDGTMWTTLTGMAAFASVASFQSFLQHRSRTAFARLVYFASMASLVLVSCVAPLLIVPSSALPDVVPLLNSIVCCLHFVWYAGFWTLRLNLPF